MARFFEAELVSVERPTSHLWVAEFRRADGEPVRARAGQFVMIHHEFDGLRLNRSYSLADPIEDSPLDRFTLAVALVDGGRFSTLLERLEPGDTVTMTGPHGRFILRDSDPEHTVLAATGTGIVPFRAMIPQLRARLEAGDTVELFYGCRTEADFLFHDDFQSLAAEFESFRYTVCASRAGDPDRWRASNGLCGRITEPVKALDIHPENAIVYLCGNPEMIEDLQAHLHDAGFDRRTVRIEAYESPTDPPPRG